MHISAIPHAASVYPLFYLSGSTFSSLAVFELAVMQTAQLQASGIVKCFRVKASRDQVAISIQLNNSSVTYGNYKN